MFITVICLLFIVNMKLGKTMRSGFTFVRLFNASKTLQTQNTEPNFKTILQMKNHLKIINLSNLLNRPPKSLAISIPFTIFLRDPSTTPHSHPPIPSSLVFISKEWIQMDSSNFTKIRCITGPQTTSSSLS